MKTDATLGRIFSTIQQELKDKKGIELGLEDIHNIADFQFTMIGVAVSKGLDIQLPKLGKFKHCDRTNRGKEKKETFKLLKDNAEVNPDFNYDEVKAAIVRNWALEAEVLESKRNKNETTITELLEAPVKNTSRLTIFKKLTYVNNTSRDGIR